MPNMMGGCCGFGKSIEPVYYEFHKSSKVAPNNYSKVWQSETVRNTINPSFNMVKKNLTDICNADETVSFRIIFFSNGM